MTVPFSLLRSHQPRMTYTVLPVYVQCNVQHLIIDREVRTIMYLVASVHLSVRPSVPPLMAADIQYSFLKRNIASL